MGKPYLSFSATVILQAAGNGYQYGFQIMDATGLPSGTVYPALRRLENANLIASAWEDEEDAFAEQRPARKYYRFTSRGDTALAHARRRYKPLANFASESKVRR